MRLQPSILSGWVPGTWPCIGVDARLWNVLPRPGDYVADIFIYIHDIFIHTNLWHFCQHLPFVNFLLGASKIILGGGCLFYWFIAIKLTVFWISIKVVLLEAGWNDRWVGLEEEMNMPLSHKRLVATLSTRHFRQEVCLSIHSNSNLP